MTESEFFERLEYRLCREFEASRLPEAPGLWCDGLIPERWQLDARPPSVSGKAWLGGLPNRDPTRYQEDWVFVLELPDDATSRDSIPWEHLLPHERARNWVWADIEHRELRMVLPPSMQSLEDAIALLNSRGLRAQRRQWSLGDTVVVTLAHGEMSAGIEVFLRSLYIVCSDGTWEVVNFMSDGPPQTIRCNSLDEACDVVTAQMQNPRAVWP